MWFFGLYDVIRDHIRLDTRGFQLLSAELDKGERILADLQKNVVRPLIDKKPYDLYRSDWNKNDSLLEMIYDCLAGFNKSKAGSKVVVEDGCRLS